MSSAQLNDLGRLQTGTPDMPIRLVEGETEAEWDGFVRRHPHASGYHLWRWQGIFERAFGHQCHYLAARDDHGIRGVLPLVRFDHRLFGRFMVSLPFVNSGGVLATDEQAARALLEEATRLGAAHHVTHVELRHETAQFPDLPSKAHKVSMRMPLDTDADKAWQSLDRKVRNQVRKAEKSGLTASVGGSELLSDFYAVFAENMRDLGTPVYPRRFFDEIVTQFPEATRIFVVRHEGKAVAASITYAFGRSLEVPTASSLKAYRSMCPNNVLYWKMIQQAITDGFTTFDFGRSTPGEGTYLFKQQWGARAGPLCWEYQLLSARAVPDRSPKNPRFRAAIEIWKRLPLHVTVRMGPPIVRFLP